MYWTWGRGGGETYSKEITWKDGGKTVKVFKRLRNRGEKNKTKTTYH